MSTSGNGGGERGSMERVGESMGAMAGRAADWGMEASGTLFRSAAEMLGGWWSSDAPRQAASAWSDRAEQSCRSHYRSGSVGATQATNAAPKSQHAAMQSAGEMDGNRFEAHASMDSASDGFERARPGYQLGYVARRNPAYDGRSFSEVEPDLRRVWESRARTESGASSEGGSSWPEVRGFVDFAYQQGEG